MTKEHRLVKHAILAVFFLNRPEVKVFYLISDERLFHEYGTAGTLLQRNPWTAERPSCSRGHIYLNTIRLTLLLCEAQHLHPFVGKIGNIIGIISLHAIERRNLQCSDAVLGILLHIPL